MIRWTEASVVIIT